MRNSLKRTLSLVLAVLMLGSVAVISASANDGAREWHTLETAMEYFEGEYGEEIPTKTYYFYMPEQWKSEHNDYYDGTENSYAAGVYWYGSTLCLPADYPFHSKDWPGYAVTKTDAPNVYVAEVPYDVHTIIFNNLVDGGEDKTLDIYTKAYQIADTPTNYDGADNYGFYPNGLESTENMIFVVDHTATSENPYNGKLGFNGAWLYYYGNGEYGTAPTKEEAGEFVYTGGEFPASNLVVKPEKNEGIGVGQTIELKPTKTPVTYVSDNEAVAVVEETDGKYILKAVGEGDATITFTYFDATTEEEETATVTINVVTPSLNCDSLTMNVGDMEFFIPTGIGDNAVWKSSNEKVVTVDGITVTAVGAGKATITVTQGDVVLECPVTVKSAVSMTSKKSAKIAAGKTHKIKIEGNSGKVKYSSSNAKVAKVSNKGVVTGLKKGKATITAKVDGQTFKTTINVTSNPTLAKKTVTVKKGKTATVKITGATAKPKVAKCKIAKITPSKAQLKIKGTKKGSQKVAVTVNGVKINLTVKVN